MSPEPDVSVRHLFPRKDRCLILGSDGLWNMLTPAEACLTVQLVEKEVEKKIVSDPVSFDSWLSEHFSVNSQGLLYSIDIDYGNDFNVCGYFKSLTLSTTKAGNMVKIMHTIIINMC